MPHDVNGKLLQVGDKVNIPCVVTCINPDGEYSDLSVDFVHPMPAYPDQKSGTSALNAKQVEKVE